MVNPRNILILFIFIMAIVFALSYLFKGDSNSALIDKIPAKTISADTIKIIAFGDSLTAGFGLPASESYPALLEQTLVAQGYKVQVINSGVSGETTRGNLERAAFISSQKPDIVLLGIGGNDALRALPIAETKVNINQTIDILKKSPSEPVVILLSMQSPLNAGFAYKRDFDNLYIEIASAKSLVLVPFVTTEVFLDPSLMSDDRIHPNKAGYQKIINSALGETVVEVLEQMEVR